MQIVEHNDDVSSGISFGRRRSFSCAVPFSPLLIIDSLSRKSFSYNKLPQEPLKLTVIKLDASSFEIEIVKTATVAELKNAVEAAFSHLQGPGKVSWSHVWGHFCLCYDGTKLLIDSDYITDYDIRDGDQLLFVRHLSINYNLKRTRSVEQVADLEQPRISDACEVEEQETNVIVDESCDDQEFSTPLQDYENNNDAIVKRYEYKLTTIFRGWFSYRRLSLSPNPNLEQNSLPTSSKSSNCLLRFRNVVWGYTNKRNPLIETWKAE